MSRVLLGALLAAMIVPALTAQTSKALISGIVTDRSGAAVVNAKITVTDIQRNLDYHTESNASGLYRVIELTPGLYRVTAEAPGFRTYVLESLSLSTQQNASFNITLEVGAVSERVEVTATGPLLESSNATLSSVVENKKIIDLPLNNRNIYSLLRLVPGITPSTPNQESDFFTSTIRFSINGGKESLNDIQLDGVTAMVQSDIQGIYGASAIPSVEGIQEFRVQTNSYTAEYGRSGGGQVTMLTKSGSNEFHGSVFEFLRNSAMDAKNFFLNRSGGRKASFQQHQYGASVGGPVFKDRTSFSGCMRGDGSSRAASLNIPCRLRNNCRATFPIPETPTERFASFTIRSPPAQTPISLAGSSALRSPEIAFLRPCSTQWRSRRWRFIRSRIRRVSRSPIRTMSVSRRCRARLPTECQDCDSLRLWHFLWRA